MKSVVRLPNWLGDIVMSIPFLIHLMNDVGAPNIVVVVKAPFDELVRFLLPSEVAVVALDRARVRGVMAAWRFARQLRQQCGGAPDNYFTLTPSLSSYVLGVMMGARKRYGYARDGGRWLLSHAYRVNAGVVIHRSEEYLQILALWSQRHTSLQDVRVADLVARLEVDARYEGAVVINANSEASSRRLPDTQWVELIGHLRPNKVILLGLARDRVRLDQMAEQMRTHSGSVLNLAGQTSLVQLATVLRSAKIMISNDSGPAHLGALVGRPVWVFFGAGDERNTQPLSYGADEKCHVCRIQLACSPCLKNVCPLGTLECLKGLEMSDVAKKIGIV